MELKVGDKVTWSQATVNKVFGDLTVTDLVKRGRHTIALLQDERGDFYTQVVQPASLEVVK